MLQAPVRSAPFGRPLASLSRQEGSASVVLQPLTLAANRLSERLPESVTELFAPGDSPEVLPPLLDQPALRAGLLRALTSLP